MRSRGIGYLVVVYGLFFVVTLVAVPFYVVQLRYLVLDPAGRYRDLELAQVRGTLHAWDDGEYSLRLELAEYPQRPFCVDSVLRSLYDHEAFVAGLESGLPLQLAVEANELRPAPASKSDPCAQVYALASERRQHFGSEQALQALAGNQRIGAWVSLVLLILTPPAWLLVGREAYRRYRAARDESPARP